MRFIDLRSDTVTRPTRPMRLAMAEAEVGDDVWGDDPTVNRLQAVAAERLGFEGSLFFPSGTQSNLAAMLTHCGRGDEVLLGASAHMFLHEGGGAAALGSIHLHPLPNQEDGSLRAEDVEAAIKPKDPHFARTRLMCLENTIDGKVVPQPLLGAACVVAHRRGLSTHLDGARFYNAVVRSHGNAREMASGFDSMTLCLSKGLGAPAGSLLLGRKAFLAEAHRWRKVLGGGMRQVGILAAAGLYALDNHVDRLEADHENATLLAKLLEGTEGVFVEPVHTNMVWLRVASKVASGLKDRLAQEGLLVSGSSTHLRLVLHLDINRDDVIRAAQVLRAAAAAVGEE
jgi:threonine aldolase